MRADQPAGRRMNGDAVLGHTARWCDGGRALLPGCPARRGPAGGPGAAQRLQAVLALEQALVEAIARAEKSVVAIARVRNDAARGRRATVAAPGAAAVPRKPAPRALRCPTSSPPAWSSTARATS